MTTSIYSGQPAEELLNTEGIFWFIAKNGVYLRRPTLLGNVIVPHKHPDIAEFDAPQGILDYNLARLPAWLIAETHDWFRRVFDRWKCEAEVLITFNPDADEPFRLFIPVQHNSHGGVHSAYNPEHLARGWQIIGSIHSHCDFAAFHSGTDTNDASEFDGLHITMGHVNTDTPSMDAMVVLNGVRWNMKIDEILDRSMLGTIAAPPWWDRYILNGTPNATLQATFDAFRPPKPPERKVWQYSGPSTSARKPNWVTTPPPNQSRWKGALQNWSFFGDSDWGDNDHYSPPKTPQKKSTGPLDLEGLIDEWCEITDLLAEHGIYPVDIVDKEVLSGPDEEDDLLPTDSPPKEITDGLH